MMRTAVFAVIAWCSATIACAARTPLISAAPASLEKRDDSCPEDLAGKSFEFPHLIIPIDEEHPNIAYGTQYNVTITPWLSTVFNFDIPWSDAGKHCYLTLILPTQDQLETSAVEFAGSELCFSSLKTPAIEGHTTYETKPGVSYGTVCFHEIDLGNSYEIKDFLCPAGVKIGVEMFAGDDLTWINFFQNYAPCPIGLYIIVE